MYMPRNGHTWNKSSFLSLKVQENLLIITQFTIMLRKGCALWQDVVEIGSSCWVSSGFESWWAFCWQSLSSLQAAELVLQRQQEAETRLSSAGYCTGRGWWQLLGLSCEGRGGSSQEGLVNCDLVHNIGMPIRYKGRGPCSVLYGSMF